MSLRISPPPQGLELSWDPQSPRSPQCPNLTTDPAFLGNGLQWQRNHHCAHGFMYKIRHLMGGRGKTPSGKGSAGVGYAGAHHKEIVSYQWSLYIYISLYISVCVCVLTFIYLFIYLFIHLFIRLFISIHIECTGRHMYTCTQFSNLLYPPCISICLSICRSIYLSNSIHLYNLYIYIIQSNLIQCV